MSHNSGDVFERLYNSPQRSHVRRVASSQLPAPKRCPSRCKIDSIEQLYRLLFERDPNLFSIKDYGWEISHRPSLNIDDIPLSNLNVFERGELMRKRSVYYVPTTSTFPTAATAQREIKLTDYEDNFGFDDVSGNYKVNLNDHINYRYQVLRNVGKGSFGKVILVQDHKVAGDDFLLALKIINNNPAASLQSVNEIKMLKCIKDHGGHRNVVEFFNQFNFRSHICITTELLSLNLYSLLEVTKFQGFSAPVVAQFGRQILQGISFLHGHSIIHCDIKPENIMVKLPADHESTELNVKLIDFGSSCFDNEQCFSYIQSRFYRAPEIILGAEYNNKIDIWSVGCVLAELFTGVPLLPGKNEIDQVGLILGIFGAPKSCTIQRFRSQLAKSFQPTTMDIESRSVLPHANQIKKTLLYKIFDQNGKINLQILNQYKAATPDLTSLKKQFRLNSKTLDICMGIAGDGTDNPLDKQSSMTRFLQKIFVWDPMARESADALLADSFLS
ncbi:uncharacterized protein LODBEIA_P04260 [Lodderomyces beijingensis]|uniref:Protein kinase domain-containing protein n=1 Tax=Lodderomyces beijingensis TaxID=1775926 RepID=A0ABP0ZFH6_9ASCO